MKQDSNLRIHLSFLFALIAWLWFRFGYPLASYGLAVVIEDNSETTTLIKLVIVYGGLAILYYRKPTTAINLVRWGSVIFVGLFFFFFIGIKIWLPTNFFTNGVPDSILAISVPIVAIGISWAFWNGKVEQNVLG